ncbi:MAG: hypothetical protein AAFU64_16635, partial [Bacteroidota bacterium]
MQDLYNTIRALLTLGIFLSNFSIYAQISNNCNAVDDYDLNAANVLNEDFDINTASFTVSATPTINDVTCITSPDPASAAPTADAWASFTAPATGNYNIEYTSTNGDAILAIYQGTCGALSFLTCINDFRNESGTESTVLNVAAGTQIHLRVISTLSGNLDGKLSIYTGSKTPGDLCLDALEVSVGTCDFEFIIGERFFNHEGRGNADPSCNSYAFDPNSNNNRDGWLKFTAQTSGIVAVEFTNLNEDAALEIYSGSCGNLTYIPNTCKNDVSGAGSELVEFDVVQDTEYFIRVINIQSGSAMQGGLCIYPVITRDLFTDATLPLPGIQLGDCNVNANVVASANLTMSN